MGCDGAGVSDWATEACATGGLVAGDCVAPDGIANADPINKAMIRAYLLWVVSGDWLGLSRLITTP